MKNRVSHSVFLCIRDITVIQNKEERYKNTAYNSPIPSPHMGRGYTQRNP